MLATRHPLLKSTNQREGDTMQRGKHIHFVALAGCLALAAWGSRAALANETPNTTAIPGWTTQDFNTTTDGSAKVDANGVWTIQGDGADTWERDDQFRIVTQDYFRGAISDDTSMPAEAGTITVTAANGTVTLRGQVPTQAAKDAIEAKAKGVAGVTSVNNQLEVKSS